MNTTKKQEIIDHIDQVNRNFWTIKAMEEFGGSFVKALAKAALHADPNNLKKIQKTWNDYWKKYEELGRKLEERSNEEESNQ